MSAPTGGPALADGPQGHGGAGAAQRRYGWSALLTGCGLMWRAIAPAMLAVFGNAAVQALLTWWNPGVGWNWRFVVALLASALACFALLAVLTAAGLQSVTGKATLRSVGQQALARSVPFLGWLAALLVAMVAGQLVQRGLAVPIALIGVFIPIAAMDGHANAAAVGFRALRARFGRWLLTSLLVVLLVLVWFLVAAVNTFFVKGMLASLLAWTVGGVLAWWLASAWAAIYRSTPVGALGWATPMTQGSDEEG